VTLEAPAVVLGAGANGLGVVRSLARAGVPAWLLDSDGKRAEMYTRAAKPLRVRALQGEALIEDLVRLGATRFHGSRPVLLLTQEETVKAVSLHRNRLSDLYRFSLPPPDVVDRLQHKQGFQRLAEQLDAPVPPLVHVRASAEVAALEKLGYPVVVKPGERHAEYSRRFKKAYRVENAEQATELVRRILVVMPDVVVQEWI
jgi:predicted ATP-grasp superfamily ATP-dependent carboligase